MSEALGTGVAGLRDRYDVAVVGGGSAGIAAALAAAAGGARTLLLEEGAGLGGNATAAFVHTLCGLYHGDEDAPRPANPGLATRFAAGLRAAGGAGPPERVGRVWVVPTDPPAIDRHARALVAGAEGLDARLGCSLVGVAAGDGSEPHRLRLEGEGARAETLASVLVDASGDGALGTLGAADCERAGEAERQLPSYIVRVAGVAPEDTRGFGRLRLAAAVAGAARDHALPEGCESVLLRPVIDPAKDPEGVADEAWLTFNVSRAEVERTADPDPARWRRALEERARGHVERIVAHLRKHRPGYGACRVTAWPQRLGVREGSRLLGRAQIDAESLLAGRRGGDDVALSAWPIELWHDHRKARFRHPEAACGIPLGALVSRSHPRIGMAGRCLSASHEALGALRVIGTALATGEAVGTAAALAVARGSDLASVSAEEVRARTRPDPPSR